MDPDVLDNRQCRQLPATKPEAMASAHCGGAAIKPSILHDNTRAALTDTRPVTCRVVYIQGKTVGNMGKDRHTLQITRFKSSSHKGPEQH